MSSNNQKYVAKGGNQNRGGNGGNRGGNGGNRNGGGNRGGNSGGNRGYGGGGETRFTTIDQVKKAWRRDLISSSSASQDEFLKTKSVQSFLNTDPTALGKLHLQFNCT